MTKSSPLAVAFGLVAALGFAGKAQAQSSCHQVHGRYALTDASTDPRCGPTALACYSGQLSNAGMFSGALFTAIYERASKAGLSGSTALFSYRGETVLTTPRGTVSFRYTGLFVPQPSTGNLLQSEIGSVSGGTGWFAAVSGHTFSVGVAIPTSPTDLTSLSGDLSGELCLAP